MTGAQLGKKATTTTKHNASKLVASMFSTDRVLSAATCVSSDFGF